MFCNPELYMHLLKVIWSCKTVDQLLVASSYVDRIYDRPFALTVFEFRELSSEAMKLGNKLKVQELCDEMRT